MEILWNDIGKENNVIDKNVNDIWFLKEKKDLLWRERFLEMILAKKTSVIDKNVNDICDDVEKINLIIS